MSGSRVITTSSQIRVSSLLRTETLASTTAFLRSRPFVDSPALLVASAALPRTGRLESTRAFASDDGLVVLSLLPVTVSVLAGTALLQPGGPTGSTAAFWLSRIGGLTTPFSCSAEFGASAEFTSLGGLTEAERMSESSLRDDGKQKTSPSSKVGLFVGIAAAAFLLIMITAILIWRLVRRPGSTGTSSPRGEMKMDGLEPTDDIDFGATTYQTNTVEEVQTDLDGTIPDESSTSVKSIIDDFL
jgi:hypothetical protein